jgi:predicted Rossmann fold flavoprotein
MERTIGDLLILGGGAAGLMAAVAAGEAVQAAGVPMRIMLLEKNTRPGVKILVCGGGRCNLTNAGSIDFLIEQFGRNGRFLSPALHAMDNDALRQWFADQGVPTHEEHDGKIYPNSNQAKSVVDALVRRTRELGVMWQSPCSAKSVAIDAADPDHAHFVVQTSDDQTLRSRYLLIAVGGQSYVRMGTTGDGYGFAAMLGHDVVTPRTAIVGLLCQEEWPMALSGVAVEQVEVRIEAPGVLPRLATGKPTPSVNDLLFTHFGVSGPAVLNPSEIVAELLEKFPTVTLKIDFVRRHSLDELAQLLRRWQQVDARKLVRTQLATLVPARLAEMLCTLCEIAPEQSCATFNAAQMHALVTRLKATRLTIHATRGFKEAMVTAGGVTLSQVDPRTMESKLVPRLYFAGEVLDLTGPSGGYNLQLAFSTGHLAGTHIAEACLATIRKAP